MSVLINHTIEEYVGTVWRLTQYGGTATTKDVANKLGVTPASTSYMFKKMAESGLVEYKEYAGVTLTNAGHQAAMRYIRRHRITERFLVDVLAIPWDRADQLSDQMEHSLPDEVVNRMEEYMGFPKTCPHGYPIPTQDGSFDDIQVKQLNEIAIGEIAEIAYVNESDPELLRYFKSHGLLPGQSLQVLERDTFGQTVTVSMNQVRLVLGSQIETCLYMKAGGE